jgi:hypothetical protein
MSHKELIEDEIKFIQKQLPDKKLDLLTCKKCVRASEKLNERLNVLKKRLEKITYEKQNLIINKSAIKKCVKCNIVIKHFRRGMCLNCYRKTTGLSR